MSTFIFNNHTAHIWCRFAELDVVVVLVVSGNYVSYVFGKRHLPRCIHLGFVYSKWCIFHLCIFLIHWLTGAWGDLSPYSRTLLFNKRGKLSTSSVLEEMLHRQEIHLNWAIHMQGILLTRPCQVEVISILKENPKEEEEADSWAGYLVAIARYRLFICI